MRYPNVAAILSTVLVAAPLTPAVAQTYARDIAFPVEGQTTLSDNFSDPRSGGRQHEGIDMMGVQMQPLLAAVDGRIRSINHPEESWGCALTIEDDEGWTYHYLHVNNDTPGTDDGIGCEQYAYAPGIERRTRVSRGQVIAYMGDSGNAENVGPHLHFEMRMPGGTAINPYESLLAARNIDRFVPADARNRTPDINTDRGLVPGTNQQRCVSGSLIKTADSTTVYYCGADARRYVFPNAATYNTWYANFSEVQVISKDDLAAIPLGGNVTYRPGVRMVKITTDPKVYAVDKGGELRWVQTPEIAAAMYGPNWAKMVDDVSDVYFINYTVGRPVSQP